MAYELDQRSPVGMTVTAVVAEELDGAVGRLRDDPDRVRAVHEARRHLKKARSALRLARGALDDDVRGHLQERLRGAARLLSGVRDAQVAVTTLERLVAADPEAADDDVRAVLEERRAAASPDPGLVDRVAAELAAVRAEVAGLQLSADGWKALRDGLRREYQRGRRARAQAREQPDAEVLHAWRRRVKDLWYHLRLLAPAWPWVLEDTAEQAHDLSELLGDDHDLANLRATLPDDATDLPARIDARRTQLQSAAHRLGDRLYAESPSDFTARIGAYWQAWRAEP